MRVLVTAKSRSTAQGDAKREESFGCYLSLSPLLSLSSSFSLLVHGLSARVRCARILLYTRSTAFRRRIRLQVQHHLSDGEGNSVLRYSTRTGRSVSRIYVHVGSRPIDAILK